MNQKITAFFAERAEHPLFYVECGSRIFGAAQADSDFDIRGFHLPSKTDYFDFRAYPDTIEVLEEDFDFVSYDLDKMFHLLAKSNPSVFEWIRSPISYFNVLPHWAELQAKLLTHIDLKTLYHHYLSLANGHLALLEKGKRFTPKTVFYLFRGLLSAELAAKGILPELAAHALFEQFDSETDAIKIAKINLAKKKQGETQLTDIEQAQILSKIYAYKQHVHDCTPSRSHSAEKLRALLRQYSFDIKCAYY